MFKRVTCSSVGWRMEDEVICFWTRSWTDIYTKFWSLESVCFSPHVHRFRTKSLLHSAPLCSHRRKHARAAALPTRSSLNVGDYRQCLTLTGVIKAIESSLDLKEGSDSFLKAPAHTTWNLVARGANYSVRVSKRRVTLLSRPASLFEAISTTMPSDSIEMKTCHSVEPN